MNLQQGWIGVDLDGTLAVYTEWKGIDHIGEPVAEIVLLVKSLLSAGVEVRIFTARMQEPDAQPHIEAWCLQHLGQVLPVTDRKDFSMAFLIDDSVVAVERNTGQFLHDVPNLISAARNRWTSGAGAPPQSFVK